MTTFKLTHYSSLRFRLRRLTRMLIAGVFLLLRPEQLHSLRKAKILRHALIVTQNFIRNHAYRLDQKYLARNFQIHLGDLPGILPDVSLTNQEAPALVEMAQNSPAKFDIFE